MLLIARFAYHKILFQVPVSVQTDFIALMALIVRLVLSQTVQLARTAHSAVAVLASTESFLSASA
jgi:hypothetical protein